MPAQHPALLRLWWNSPLVVRLVPALALLAATGTGIAANLPTAPHQPHAATPPPQVTSSIPTTAPAPPPLTTSTPPPSEPATSPTTTTKRSTTRTSTTTTPPPAPRASTPATTSTSPPSSTRPRGVTEGQSCDEPGDTTRSGDGDRYVCDYDDGTWRWREW